MEKVEIGLATLYYGDCREVMEDIADNSIDAVIIDPPYGIAYRTQRRKVMATPEMLANDDEAPVDSVAMMAKKIKDGGAMYLATRFDVAHPWVVAMQEAGLAMKTPIFWDKTNHTAGDLEGDYGGQVEIFLFAHKGRHKLRGRRQNNLWRCARPPAGEHPTPKPESLMKRMVLNSTDKGGTVADFFMGSGTTGVSAVEEGRIFVGVEVSRQYFDLSCRRIERAQKQQCLF